MKPAILRQDATGELSGEACGWLCMRYLGQIFAYLESQLPFNSTPVIGIRRRKHEIKSVMVPENWLVIHKICFDQTYPILSKVPWDIPINVEDPNVEGQEP